MKEGQGSLALAFVGPKGGDGCGCGDLHGPCVPFTVDPEDAGGISLGSDGVWVHDPMATLIWGSPIAFPSFSVSTGTTSSMGTQGVPCWYPHLSEPWEAQLGVRYCPLCRA